MNNTWFCCEQVASSSISFERLLSLAQDIVVRENSFGNQEASPEGGPRRSRKDGVTIVCAAELPLHFDGVEQCVLGIRVALGNVPRVSSAKFFMLNSAILRITVNVS